MYYICTTIVQNYYNSYTFIDKSKINFLLESIINSRFPKILIRNVFLFSLVYNIIYLLHSKNHNCFRKDKSHTKEIQFCKEHREQNSSTLVKK